MILNRKNVIVLLSFLMAITNAISQEYEVYDNNEFSVMFVVNNEIAEDVKFANKGDSIWSDFDVIETINWNGQSDTNCIFSFYVIADDVNAYQIDYYEDNHIWVFEIDGDLKQIGDGWKLKRRSDKTETLGGIVLQYNSNTKTGCFFTIAEMVADGVAKSIDAKVTDTCYSNEYGNGVLINFENVPKTATYAKPVEGQLMSYEGVWKVIAGNYVFYVSKIEPFF